MNAIRAPWRETVPKRVVTPAVCHPDRQAVTFAPSDVLNERSLCAECALRLYTRRTVMP